MKNIIVISTSLRKNGNSERLADAFVKGAKEAGHMVEKCSLCYAFLHRLHGMPAQQAGAVCNAG